MRVAFLVLLLGCSGQEEPAPGDPCLGDGPVSIAIGEGTDASFSAWEEGEVVDTVPRDDGEWRLAFSVRTTGLDTTEATTAVYRLALDGGATEDYASGPYLSCEGEAGFTSAVIGNTTPLSGPATLSVTLTDANGTSATADLSLVLEPI